MPIHNKTYYPYRMVKDKRLSFPTGLLLFGGKSLCSLATEGNDGRFSYV
jgi:hypothetical protein